MSKLDDIFEYDVFARAHGETKHHAKQEVKRLMVETYNEALRLYYIEKSANNLDEAFDKAVEKL